MIRATLTSHLICLGLEEFLKIEFQGSKVFVRVYATADIRCFYCLHSIQRITYGYCKDNSTFLKVAQSDVSASAAQHARSNSERLTRAEICDVTAVKAGPRVARSNLNEKNTTDTLLMLLLGNSSCTAKCADLKFVK